MQILFFKHNFLLNNNKGLENPAASRYVSGIGVHWFDRDAPFSNLDETHQLYPDDTFLLGTEGCEGLYFNYIFCITPIFYILIYHDYIGFSTQKQYDVQLGSWERLESYAYDVIQVSLAITIHYFKVAGSHES